MTFDLVHAGFLISLLFGFTGFAVLFFPDTVRRAAAAFPRHVWLGRGLCALTFCIVTAVLLQADLGRFNRFQPALYILGPVAIGLVSWLLMELLAARALGGLLLLAANPLLEAARAQTPWRIALSLVAYAAVLAGMILIVGPHWFRRATQPALSSKNRTLLTGLISLGLGIGFFLLAVGPYRTGE